MARRRAINQSPHSAAIWLTATVGPAGAFVCEIIPHASEWLAPSRRRLSCSQRRSEEFDVIVAQEAWPGQLGVRACLVALLVALGGCSASEMIQDWAPTTAANSPATAASSPTTSERFCRMSTVWATWKFPARDWSITSRGLPG